MLEGVTFDQLRFFVAAAEEKSFSAAGRRLSRAQSVISQGIANLEGQLGVELFKREGRYPELTQAGTLLLGDAKAMLGGMSLMKSRARGMAAGLETELSVAVDVMFPMSILTRAAAGFGEKFPLTPLRLYVEVLGGVAQSVLDQQCQIGIMGSLPLLTDDLLSERLLAVEMVFVAAPEHPLSLKKTPLTDCDLAQHVQLVLTDRTELSVGREFRVLSPRNWRLADLGAKHAFLLAGLGWGSMPVEMVERDLKEGRLCELQLLDLPKREQMTMSATYRINAPPGPAGRWFVEQLKYFTGTMPALTSQD
ncbi:LysR family transcriptional regulator [Acidocella aminolytica]|jgi:DNA-binding transcriptional LysR family regulator|uniref:Transcriptional regulator LysR n=2 Tax=Acidocella TaxID=50709 RepID=A0A0D6PD75_9PROT|nr:LysR family transcriptional regulator [Acidocella aminolytica]GAN79311.1 transcriptional regulator LysR [Acidocella aminolytica 101 = DSM 11237]GBQ39565.1 LysR family transcriptional regulator [Acidocella aminolytica 101 = DSM 11237]SHE38108.1 transcriptional regulator, LysR family [Acidocella aminolytica 101 = DSM 11237]